MVLKPTRIPVLTTGEARDGLNQIANTFSRDGLNSLPVIFGRHRKPQGLIIPIELWDLVEDAWDLAQADQALADADNTWLTPEAVKAQLATR